MKKIKAHIAVLILLFTICSDTLLAQSQGEDFMRSIGHIYVVIAVIIAIFLGLIVFLIYLDRRLTKFEKNNFE